MHALLCDCCRQTYHYRNHSSSVTVHRCSTPVHLYTRRVVLNACIFIFCLLNVRHVFVQQKLYCVRIVLFFGQISKCYVLSTQRKMSSRNLSEHISIHPIYRNSSSLAMRTTDNVLLHGANFIHNSRIILCYPNS